MGEEMRTVENKWDRCKLQLKEAKARVSMQTKHLSRTDKKMIDLQEEMTSTAKRARCWQVLFAVLLCFTFILTVVFLTLLSKYSKEQIILQPGNHTFSCKGECCNCFGGCV